MRSAAQATTALIPGETFTEETRLAIDAAEASKDAEAVAACLRFMDDHRIVVEPACGAVLALAYEAGERLGGFDNVLAIVCGGATATVAQLQAWDMQLRQLRMREGPGF